MQGAYRGAALRSEIRRQWAEHIVPDLIRTEIEPLRQLMPAQTDIVCLDVGANKGFWAAALIRTFPGEVACVHMIDPSPENFRELTNVQDNLVFSPEELRLTAAYPFAMSAHAGSVTLHTNEDGSPLASVYPDTTRGFSFSPDWVPVTEAFEVPADTVDAFMARQRLDRVHILKADVEGHEMAVFEGAEAALSRRAIDVVFFEFGIHQISSRHFFVDFYDLFDRHGYDLWAAEAGVLRPIPHYTYEFENHSKLHNLYAVRRPALEPEPTSREPETSAPNGLFDRLRRRFD